MATKIRADVYDFLCACLRNKPPEMPTYTSIDAVANRFMQLARQAQRYNLLHANVGLTEAQEKREARMEQEFFRLCQQCGWQGVTGGDPRGYALKILFPDGSSNSWGGTSHGWGIPQ